MIQLNVASRSKYFLGFQMSPYYALVNVFQETLIPFEVLKL